MTQVRTRSVSDGVAARLERLIAVGDLAPGDRLPGERDLAATLNVSRSSVREAMHALEAKHLVERRPGRGTTVRAAPEHVAALHLGLPAGQQQALEVAELRETVEPRLAQLAAERATEADLIALAGVLEEAGSGPLTPAESMRLDLEFHLLVAQAAHSQLMASLITLTAGWTRSTRALSHATVAARRLSHEGHVSILAAIAERSPAGASAAMTSHLVEVDALTRARIKERRQR